jgi:hypothetical protein
LDFSDNSTYITKVIGKHKNGKSHKDVKAIMIQEEACLDSQLKIIPKGFLKFFPNLIGMQYRGCFFKSLNGNELKEYKKLKVFGILYSSLERIPGNFLSSTPKMKGLSFKKCEIKHVGEGLLDNLKRLKYLDFIGNTCIDETANTKEGIEDLIENLKGNCKDNQTEVLNGREIESKEGNQNSIMPGPPRGQSNLHQNENKPGNFNMVQLIDGQPKQIMQVQLH